jgi:hypothetical protein
VQQTISATVNRLHLMTFRTGRPTSYYNTQEKRILSLIR